MFSSVLVALKPTVEPQYVLEHALTICGRLDAQLSALTVIDADRIAPPTSVPLGAGVYKREWDDKLITEARAQAERLVADCQAAAESAGLSCQARIVDGEVVAAISQAVQEHDLLVVGHSPGDPTGDGALLNQILRSSARPAIVLPKRRSSGNSILVAYDGSYQAARTLASFAYSGLASGQPVHVLACHADHDAALKLCHAAARFLQRHGLSTELHPTAAAPGEEILAAAARLSAGWIVMGAFGRTSVAEFFFGSTTRSVLQELPVPLFLDH